LRLARNANGRLCRLSRSNGDHGQNNMISVML
jgi:hypothetical protein